MDPLAHTLVGATLAESGLKRHSRLATAALVLGANAPDIDVLAQLGGADASLALRRGHTHGVIAMLLLPVAIVGLLSAWESAVRRRRTVDAEPLKRGPLFLLALGATLTHPLLDWLNTYGVRLLMPFDERWFYGDSLFIIDPWMWLLMAAAVVIARTRGKLSLAAWTVVGLATTALVTATELVPFGAKVTWLAGVLLIVALRSRATNEKASRIALAALALLAIYASGSFYLSQRALADARTWLRERELEATLLAADPQPGNPFKRVVIALVGDQYHFVERSFFPRSELRFGHPSLPVGPRDGAAHAALSLDALRGFRAWLRFPSVEVERQSSGYRVTIRDVRYARMVRAPIGTRVVELDDALHATRISDRE